MTNVSIAKLAKEPAAAAAVHSQVNHAVTTSKAAATTASAANVALPDACPSALSVAPPETIATLANNAATANVLPLACSAVKEEVLADFDITDGNDDRTLFCCNDLDCGDEMYYYPNGGGLYWDAVTASVSLASRRSTMAAHTRAAETSTPVAYTNDVETTTDLLASASDLSAPLTQSDAAPSNPEGTSTDGTRTTASL